MKSDIKKTTIVFLLAAVALTVFSLAASSFPDGLEAAAERFGFDSLAHEGVRAFAPDYALSCIKNEYLSAVFAGLLGIVAVFALTAGGFRFLSKKDIPARKTN
ncbi:MAG: PDGLE domain-containing protein [Endomicrobiia bacterium]|nr:PDGLE domain-containing protein [Endomicrobiia bacterium]